MSLKEQSISLSFRLLKPNVLPNDALRKSHALKPIPSATGILYAEQSFATPPTWLSFLEGLTSTSIGGLVNQSCSAVLFLEVPVPLKKPRWMALSFGGGHHSLDPAAFERNFGLRTALNCISDSNLRNLDVATLDATSFQKRIQASRRSKVEGFGIGIERDLLRLAAGVPSDSSFAKSLAGKDALTIHATLTPTQVIDRCTRALQLFYGDAYKKDYPWVDYISLISDASIISDLDKEVFSEINSLIKGRASDLHIIFPEIFNPEEGQEVSYFGAGLSQGKKKVFPGLEIEDYISQIQAGRPADVDSMSTLKTTHEVRLIVDGKGDRSKKQKIYECFVMEIRKGNSTYVLFNGSWYEIDKHFYADVEDSFVSLVSASPIAIQTSSTNEREFIVELDANTDLLNLDQVKLAPTGAPGANIEPCDFLCRSKRFIHLKDGHSSAPISHLWNQGLVSAESFVRDSKFRKDLRDAAKSRQSSSLKSGFDLILPDGRSQPNPKDFKVVFGIMRSRNKRSNKLSLPFFSKVSLRAVANRIMLMGYTVEIHLVEKI